MPIAKSGVTTVDATPASAAVQGQGLDTPLRFVTGIGPQRAKLLAKLGLDTVEDALLHLPSRHEDRSQLVPLARITEGESRTCAGTIRGVSPPPRGRSRAPLSVLLGDGTGFLTAVWFNQPYLERVFQRGQRLIVHGKVARYGGGSLQIQVKDYEIAEEGEDDTLHTGRLVPVYRLTQGLTQRPLRSPRQATPRRLRPPRPGGAPGGSSRAAPAPRHLGGAQVRSLSPDDRRAGSGSPAPRLR